LGCFITCAPAPIAFDRLADLKSMTSGFSMPAQIQRQVCHYQNGGAARRVAAK